VFTPPLRLVFDIGNPAIQAEIEACEAEVFTAWFDNSAEELASEYGPYPNTHWLAVLDAQDRVVGASRLFLPSDRQSKTLDDLARDPWNVDPDRAVKEAGLDPATTVDFATIAVRPGAGRNGLPVSRALIYGWFAVVRANNYRSLTLIVDDIPDQILQAGGVKFHTLPGASAQPYLGSASSRPVYGHLEELLDVQRRLSPDDYAATGLGIGLEPVEIPPLEAFVVPGSQGLNLRLA
jgi:hypothetical protein